MVGQEPPLPWGNAWIYAAQKILPAGALLWAWDEDKEFQEAAGEKWLVLHPGKYNRHVQYAWRFDPCELGMQSSTAQQQPRAPRVELATPEDEFLDTDDEDDMDYE